MSEALVEVSFFDTSLRDGAQALPYGHQFPDGVKPEIAKHIASLGIDTIEAGFPGNSADFLEVEAVAKTVGRDKVGVETWSDGKFADNVITTPEIAGLARAHPADIEATWKAVSPASRARIHLFAPTDDRHITTKFAGAQRSEVLSMIRDGVSLAKQLQINHSAATIEFSPEIATTSDSDFLERSVKTALEQGADVINVPDTVGQRDPFWMYDFYRRVIRWVVSVNSDATISAHNHNDLGMAVANTLALVRAAADHASHHSVRIRTQLETVISNAGERAGNADIFPVAAALFQFSSEMAAKINWQFNPAKSVKVATTVLGFANLEVPHKNPIVGAGINEHLSGVHSDAILKGGKKGHELYTPFDPVFWGHTEHAVHGDGKYQGRRGREAARQQIDRHS